MFGDGAVTVCDLRLFADGQPQRVRPPKSVGLAASFERRRGCWNSVRFLQRFGFF